MFFLSFLKSVFKLAFKNKKKQNGMVVHSGAVAFYSFFKRFIINKIMVV